jgi:hypothetical protein
MKASVFAIALIIAVGIVHAMTTNTNLVFVIALIIAVGIALSAGPHLRRRK